MTYRAWMPVALLLALCALPATADAPAPADRSGWPEAIEDNSFLVEEAYNQEAGVVQWIFGFSYARPDRSWTNTFTNEWPVPAETHQLSYTVPYSIVDGPGDGVGDVLLNYRYQLAKEETSFASMAPRLSVILPTGDWRRGRGYGAYGLQFDFAMSRRVTRSLAVHANLGATMYRGARATIENAPASQANLSGVNEGASVIWLVTPRLNLMLEAIALQDHRPAAGNTRERVDQAFVSPGLRYAFNFPKGQLVLGVASPIGLTSDSPAHGVFLYLSWEAPVWKPAQARN